MKHQFVVKGTATQLLSILIVAKHMDWKVLMDSIPKNSSALHDKYLLFSVDTEKQLFTVIPETDSNNNLQQYSINTELPMIIDKLDIDSYPKYSKSNRSNVTEIAATPCTNLGMLTKRIEDVRDEFHQGFMKANPGYEGPIDHMIIVCAAPIKNNTHNCVVGSSVSSVPFALHFLPEFGSALIVNAAERIFKNDK